MRKSLLVVLGVLLLISAPSASAVTETSNVSCSAADGRERLKLDGVSSTFEAPPPYPAIYGTVDTGTPGAPVQPFRRAVMEYQADFSPAAAADITIDVKWADFTNDFDVFVFGADGAELGRSVVENAATQTAAERVVLNGLISHCDQFTVLVLNFLSVPSVPLDYSVKVTGTGALTCAEGDTAPGCANKPAGATPEAVADSRGLFYLSGDPGQAAMAHGFNAAVPTRSALTTTRPASAKPNSYTRALLGNPRTDRNVLMAHFSKTFTTPYRKTGPASALVYLSSPTLAQAGGGTVLLSLWADGTMIKEVKVAGATVAAHPTPVKVDFGTISFEDISRVTLQIGTLNPVISGGTAGDTTFTTWYDSVQFPARLTLP